MKALFIYSIIILGILSIPATARVNTPNWWNCTGRISGDWIYARTPYACNANVFGEDSFVFDHYKVLIMDDRKSRTAERSRYMNYMFALLMDSAEIYMKRRKPNVSATELKHWKDAVLMTAAHETRWSHYRIGSDGRLKMMRGDLGHGHGMMQIDDRFHITALKRGIAWNIATQMSYALDILYAGWERAPKMSCVGSPTNYTARIRSAWGQYNGGGGAICRWRTRPGNKYDKGFDYFRLNKSWNRYITNHNVELPMDLACLMDGQSGCSNMPTPPPAPTPPPEPSLAEAYMYNYNGQVCLLSSGKLHCVADSRDHVCLAGAGFVKSSKIRKISEAQYKKYTNIQYDRHELCQKYDKSLIAVGKKIKLNKSINLRSTAAGGYLLTVPKGTIATVLDFEMRSFKNNDRYYKISYNNKTGYIYSGTYQTYKAWTEVYEAPYDGKIALPGETIQIVTRSGINMRRTPGGAYRLTVPRYARVTVIKYVVTGSNNSVYYQVNYRGYIGYIYSGRLLPTDTTPNWTKRFK